MGAYTSSVVIFVVQLQLPLQDDEQATMLSKIAAVRSEVDQLEQQVASSPKFEDDSIHIAAYMYKHELCVSQQLHQTHE